MHDPNSSEASNRNEDPITHEPGAHPVSTGVGALGGGVTGATIGMVFGGPVGSAVGAVIGAVFGGLGGSAVGEAIDPTVEDEYWKTEHPTQPHATSEYSSFEPAYRVGYEGYDKHGGHQRTFDEAEETLRSEYEAGGASLSWEQARDAARAAWSRVHSARGRRTEPVEGSSLQAKNDGVTPDHDDIASRAWSFYEASDRQDGHDLEHWLRAEQESRRSHLESRTESFGS
ncbi:MAG: hypothetical protein JWL59_506 [Chthoniobacteraceae bacterium]|nr:hypothetical protein [Chthoniobacteraceae bacterium]